MLLIDHSIDWLVDWLIDALTDWLIDGWIVRLIDWLIVVYYCRDFLFWRKKEQSYSVDLSVSFGAFKIRPVTADREVCFEQQKTRQECQLQIKLQNAAHQTDFSHRKIFPCQRHALNNNVIDFAVTSNVSSVSSLINLWSTASVADHFVHFLDYYASRGYLHRFRCTLQTHTTINQSIDHSFGLRHYPIFIRWFCSFCFPSKVSWLD